MAKSVYDLLRVLIERQGWPSENDKMEWLETVVRAENSNVFGPGAVAMKDEVD